MGHQMKESIWNVGIWIVIIQPRWLNKMETEYETKERKIREKEETLKELISEHEDEKDVDTKNEIWVEINQIEEEIRVMEVSK